jgi:Domain of unknown function (DUF5659)
LENKYFYCYSVRLKDFLKSKGFNYITKALNPNSKKPYFLFEKSEELDKAIIRWNEVKIENY